LADIRSGDGIVGGDAGDTGDNHSALNGREYATAAEFVASVDNSVWDFTVGCGSCHVGGGLAQEGKELPDGSVLRHSQRPTPTAINAYDYTVAEYWMGPADQAANPGDAQYYNGAPAHYEGDMGNYPTNADGSAATKLPGFAPQVAMWKYPYPLPQYGMNNFMMPNVHEMDCLFCHMEGYNNVVSSVAVQMGALNAAPAMGAGLLNMFTQAYIPGVVETMTVNNPLFGSMDIAYLPGSTVSRIKANPTTDNCRLCHAPKTMENFSDMFDQFLSSAPMEFNPASSFAGPTGMAMPGYDLNAAFISPMMASESPAVYGQPDGSWVYADGSDAGGPFDGLFPMALFQTYKNVTPLQPALGEFGGKNLPMSGPIYFNGGLDYDQSALKKATIPFPRADFFKRGDLFDNTTQEIHASLGCAGCHMDTNTTNTDKGQCDPGLGYTRLGGVKNGFNGGPNIRNTVKRCENCHITGKNNEGIAIDTFGAPNPTAKHTAAGLLAGITTGVDGLGNDVPNSNHLDVVDCSVCHMKKQSMAVRALDCLSGNRYPTMVGFQQEKGMMAMFTDPMGLKDVPEDQFNAITGLPYPKSMYVNEMVDWSTQPEYAMLRGWWRNGPKDANSRYKIYNLNLITAILWDNNGDFDANGDVATGAEADAMMAGAGLGFDPWIQRDLKVGNNFADTGFAVVPIGFGDPMDPTNVYGSVYTNQTANGFNPNSAWDYVGVYGGNIVFTTPEQINDYQAFRTAMNPAKPWEQTAMTIFGGPFQVTHNIVDTDIAVLGKSCNDCHDANSNFFSGGYDMTGTAVPTADSYDMSGMHDIYAADGSMVQDLSAYNMMQRPLVDYEVTAEDGDLITGAEAVSKRGVVHEVEFEEEGCWDAATKTFDTTCATPDHVRSTDLNRSEFLYFDEADVEAKVAALEINRTLADYVHAPVATINTAGPVEVGATINLVADTTGNDANAQYLWTCTDTADEVLEGSTVAKTFSKVGTWTVTLKVINAAGELAQASAQITVAAPAPAADIAIVDPQPAGSVNTVTISNLPAEYTKLYIIWGDGTKQYEYPVGSPASVDVNHKYLMYSKYLVGGVYNYKTTVYVYNGAVRVGILQATVQVAH